MGRPASFRDNVADCVLLKLTLSLTNTRHQYQWHQGRMYNGLIVVMYALQPVKQGDGVSETRVARAAPKKVDLFSAAFSEG
eukprot:COSAG02_NODE_1883_length_10535_cov_4.902070_2_plen_81_part_00